MVIEKILTHLDSKDPCAATVVPMAGEVATCADVWEFSRPPRPDDRPMTADTTSKRQLTAD